MNRAQSFRDLGVGVAAAVTGLVGSYALVGWSAQFLVVPIDQAVVNATPGPIVAASIETLGDAGHILHVALSLAIAVSLLAFLAVLGRRAGRSVDSPFVAPLAVAGGTGLLVWTLTTAPLATAAAAIPPAVVVFAATPHPKGLEPETSAARRGFLTAVAGSATLAVGGTLFGSTLDGPSQGPGSVEVFEVEDEVSAAAAATLSIDGIEPLVSENFYTVDIASAAPRLSRADWTLSVTGEVENEQEVDYASIVEDSPRENRFVTLRCVGDDLNGKKMDNALWTGTPLGPLIEDADVSSDCGCAMLRAADGYHVEIPLEALKDSFIAYGMNGTRLPRSHGYPVRILVPGHWGETNVKWIQEIEFLDKQVDGYWEKRGWRGTGPVETVAKLHAKNPKGDGRVELGGHAYAGTRGIERVEVSTDGGDSWERAELSEALPGDDVWRQWRYTFAPDEPTDVVVRATDGTGTVQPEEYSGSYPSGATGWVKETVSPP